MRSAWPSIEDHPPTSGGGSFFKASSSSVRRIFVFRAANTHRKTLSADDDHPSLKELGQVRSGGWESNTSVFQFSPCQQPPHFSSVWHHAEPRYPKSLPCPAMDVWGKKWPTKIRSSDLSKSMLGLTRLDNDRNAMDRASATMRLSLSIHCSRLLEHLISGSDRYQGSEFHSFYVACVDLIQIFGDDVFATDGACFEHMLKLSYVGSGNFKSPFMIGMCRHCHLTHSCLSYTVEILVAKWCVALKLPARNISRSLADDFHEWNHEQVAKVDTSKEVGDHPATPNVAR